MTREGSAHFFKLEKDITCSVCLDELSDPVSITCGYTFCRPCISSYWDTPQPLGHRCPECRKVCPREQLIPVYRLQNLVSKVQLSVKEKQSKMIPARAVQLVYTDEESKMCLDESAVEKCFLEGDISDYPLCLICVIGEKRRGKSSLLNYILRALYSLEKGQPVSLGEEDEPLSGFDWKSGTDSLTKGIWVWDRPFILERNGEKMAVFILDTEGSLDIESDRETCIKLSALSMLLSSFLDFVSTLQREHIRFSSPMEMFYALENHKNMKNTVKKFQDFVETEAPMTSSPFKILGVRTSKMRMKVTAESSRLLEAYGQNLKGSNDAEKQKFIDEAKTLLDKEVEKFCAEYSWCFLKCAVGVGCAVGGGVLSLAGGVLGAAVAGTVLAAEAAALLGSTTAAVVTGAVGGSVTLGAIGTGVGGAVGGVIGHKEKEKGQVTDDGCNVNGSTSEDKKEDQETDECNDIGSTSDKEKLLPE